MPNFYEVLGVSENADDSEIKKAYMKLSLKYHPDRNPENVEEATKKFQEINTAYEELKDESSRAKYNNKLKYGDSHPLFSGGNEMNDINNLFNMMFSGPMGGGFPGFPGMGGGMPGNIHVFHMGGPGMNPEFIFQQQKPQPILKTIDISIEHAYFGGSYTIDLERNIIKNGMHITEIETIHVDIPKGISNKEVIVVSNRGHMINENNIGDLKISVNVLPHNIFKREGNDLVFLKKLSLKESLCGFSLEIKHLNGKILNMNNTVNPTIIKPGYKKIVPNMGMITNQQTGNLIIDFEIEFPDNLDSDKIESLKNIL